jgi:UDP-N-acetyl-2-amino-2-deoxyglucuronate dehydrogenase
MGESVTMPKRRLAIIGLGMAVTPHAKSLVDLAERVEVAAAFSRSAERAKAFAANFAFPTITDLDGILSDRTIDVALILTPPNARLEFVRRFAEAGKHILLEKPLEVSAERAAALVETCGRAGVTLGVVLQHRFREAATALEGLIAAGELGEIAAASVAVRWWRPQSYYDEPGRGTRAGDGGGVLLTQAIHTLDLFQSLAGPVVEVAAFAGTSRAHQMETEDTCGAALRFANGALGTLDATTAAYPGFPERIEIIGTKATAVLGGGLELFRRDGRHGMLVKPVATGGGADPMAFPHDAHRAVLADFLDALDQRRAPKVSGAEALKVHRLIDALLRSSAERRPVTIEP